MSNVKLMNNYCIYTYVKGGNSSCRVTWNELDLHANTSKQVFASRSKSTSLKQSNNHYYHESCMSMTHTEADDVKKY